MLADRVTRLVGSGWTLTAIVVLAATLRIWHVIALRPLPLFDRLILDSEYYDTWAQSIAGGQWMGGDRAFFFDPLYTYVLAVIYRTVGRDLLVVRLLNVVFGTTTCAVTGYLGRRVGGPVVGNLAALLVALYGPAIYQEGEVEKTALGVCLITIVLALALCPSPGARFATGVALGLAALTRGNVLILAPFAAVDFLRAPSPGGEGVGDGWTRWRRRLAGSPGRGAALFVAGLLAVLAPVAVRNHLVSGEWILTTAGGGTNFYTGNNPANQSGGFHSVPFVRPQSMHEEEDFRAEAEVRTGRRLGPRELSSYWFRQSVRHMWENPGFALRVFANKTVLFWADVELADTWDMGFLARYSMVLALPLVTLAWLLPFAVIGAGAVVSHSPAARMLVGYALLYSASVIAFYVFSRYRLHVLPALAVLAAAGIVWVIGRARSAGWGSIARAAAAGALVMLLSLRGAHALVGLAPDGQVNSFVNLAGLFMERGAFEEAVVLLREAHARYPRHAAVLCRIGEMGVRTGRYADARDAYLECLRANPRYPDAWYSLGLAYEGMGQVSEAVAAFRNQLVAVPGHGLASARLSALGAER